MQVPEQLPEGHLFATSFFEGIFLVASTAELAGRAPRAQRIPWVRWFLSDLREKM